MRKILLFTMILVCAISSMHAQTTKGSILIGGNVSFASSVTENNAGNDLSKSIGFTVSPSVGLALNQHTVAGIRLSYSNSHNTISDGSAKTTGNFYGGGIFLRKYLMLARNLYLQGEASANYIRSKEKEEGTQYSNRILRSSGYSLIFTPGISYVVNKRLHVELNLNNLVSFNYNITELQYVSDPSNNRKYKSFAANTGLSTGTPLSFGFRYIIPK